MAITAAQLDGLTAGTQLRMDAKDPQNVYDIGTTVLFMKKIPVQNKPMAMVNVPGGRPFAMPPDSLTLLDEAAPAAEEESNPVFDFFAQHADLDDAMVVNFAAAYIDTLGDDDVSTIAASMDAANIPVGQRWTPEQTAKLAEEFYTSFGLPLDDLVVAALAPKPAPEKPKATAKAADKPAATKSAPAETAGAKAAPAGVGKEAASASTLGALNILAAIAPFYAEAPNAFDADLALALKQLKAAVAVK